MGQGAGEVELNSCCNGSPAHPTGSSGAEKAFAAVLGGGEGPNQSLSKCCPGMGPNVAQGQPVTQIPRGDSAHSIQTAWKMSVSGGKRGSEWACMAFTIEQETRKLTASVCRTVIT